MKYSQKVLEHFMNPRNVGEIPDADGIARVGNPACGDIVVIHLKVSGNKIVYAKFKTFGCGAAIATSSVVTELAKGKTLEEAEKISHRTVLEALDGLPLTKIHCSNQAADGLHAALRDYRRRNGIPKS